MALLPRRFNAADRASDPAEDVAMYPELADYLTADEGAHSEISFPCFQHDGQPRRSRGARSTLSSKPGPVAGELPGERGGARRARGRSSPGMPGHGGALEMMPGPVAQVARAHP